MKAESWIRAAALSAALVCLAALSAAFVCLAAPGRAAASEIWSRAASSLSLDGSLRQIALYTRQTDADGFSELAAQDAGCLVAATFADCPAFDRVGEREVGLGLARLRVEAEFSVSDWFLAVVAYDNQLQVGVLDTLEAGLDSDAGSRPFLAGQARLDRGSHHDWEHQLYRAYARAEAGPLELTVGRQRVAWGVGRLWNPIDRFSALPPLSLQPGVTPGIDGIDARFNFDGFNYLEFVYAPGGRPREQRWALRLHGVAWDADVSLVGGAFERAPTLGVDLARNLGDAAIGLEAVFTSPAHKVWKLGEPAPRRLPDYWQVVASIDINLDYGSGVYVLAEYLYNGNALGFGRGRAGPLLPLFEATREFPAPALAGIPGPYVASANLDVFGSSRVVTGAEHQLGLQLGYDLTPVLRGGLVSLIDLDAGSAAFFPNLGYSPLGSVELTLGVQLFVGPRRSQYGAAEPLVHLLADWFF